MVRVARYFPTIIYIVTLLLLFVDVVGSSTTFYKFFGVYSYDLAFVSLIILSLFRIFTGIKLFPVISGLNTFVIFPLFFVTGILLTLINSVTHANYIFSLLRVQITQIFLIGVYAGVIVLLQKSKEWFNSNRKKVLFYTPIVVFELAWIVDMFPFGVLREMSVEDRFIENVQVTVLVVAIYYCIKNISALYKRKEYLSAVIFSLGLFVLVFTAGEEISWGQRIFHFDTPSFIERQNVQKELTIHNLEGFGNKKVSIAYIIVGFFGTFSWLLRKTVKVLNNAPYVYFIPPWFISSYYFFGFLFNLYTRLDADHIIGHYSETVECILYAGMAVTMYQVYRSYLSKYNNSES